MSRFYWERKGEQCWVYDRTWSNSIAICIAYDDNVADMVCTALNKLWEKPQ